MPGLPKPNDDDEGHTSPWDLEDGPDDAEEAARGTLPRVSDTRPYLADWIKDHATDPPPAHMFDGQYLHPLRLDTPAVLYVWDDPDDRAGKSVRGCGTTGPVTLYPGRGLSHYGVPCGNFADEQCGPLRCMKIAEQVAARWSPLTALYLYRIDADDPEQLKRTDGVTGRKLERGRVADVIASRGGEHLSIVVQRGDAFHCFVFSTVDHATVRPNRGSPPRRTDALPTADALAYVHELLRAGIMRRSASRSVGLDDATGMGRGTGRGLGIPLGQLGGRLAKQVEPMMRRLYERSGGTKWPDHEPTPRDRSRIDLAQLGRDAIDAVKFADAARRAKIGGLP